MENSCLDAAIKYATKYGWAVFPIRPETKRPYTPHGCKDAKKDVGAIRAWWKRFPDAAVGVATGSASQLIVIDEDIDDDKGVDGYHSVTIWEKENGELPETVRAITGRGGSHLYYHYTGSDIGNRAGILEGVDVRGEGGYVIAPPSLHPNGSNYEWEYDPEDIAIAEVDDTVRTFLKTGKESNGERFKMPARIESGQRNDTLYRMACSLQAQGLPDSAIWSSLEETNKTACDVPLEDTELQLIYKSAISHNKGELKVVSDYPAEQREPDIAYQIDSSGNVTDRPVQSIKNAMEAIEFDPELFGKIRYNEMSYSINAYGNLPWKTGKGWREWTDADDSNLRAYIENKYKLKNAQKVMDALTNVTHKYPINPVKDMLEYCYELWDGNKYVENLLPLIVGAEKSEYNTTALRTFMLGAVSRAFRPGCKFDYMLVLVGGQGIQKSSFFRCLALNDAWYDDNFSTLDGARAVEKLRGMWIVELAELQATKKTKDVETIKSFITSRIDSIRAPYQRRTEQRPRRCVLAGTSNPTDFLTDSTGNRRFLPITCTKGTFDLYANEDATKHMFVQAWGEVMHEYKEKNGKVRLVLPDWLAEEAIQAQLRYTEEDVRIGIIQEWLDSNTEVTRVCAPMIWERALKRIDEPSRKDVREIHEIMRNSISGWKDVGKQRNVSPYGRQKSYDRVKDFVDISLDDVPY